MKEVRYAICVVVPAESTTGWERFRMYPDTLERAYAWIEQREPRRIDRWVITEETHTWDCEHTDEEKADHPDHEVESRYRYLVAGAREWTNGPYELPSLEPTP